MQFRVGDTVNESIIMACRITFLEKKKVFFQIAILYLQFFCLYSRNIFDLVGFFRGCAPSFFPLDQRCRIELESVLVGSGSQRVAPRVELCFCNSNKCNALDTIEEFRLLINSGEDLTQFSVNTFNFVAVAILIHCVEF